MKQTPRKLDPKVVWNTPLYNADELLCERYPWLTAEQHAWRARVALHEASHLVTAVEIARRAGDYNFGANAFIRVPAQGRGGKRGRDGAVTVGNQYRHEDDMLVSAAGYFASFLMGDPDHNPELISASDVVDFTRRQDEMIQEQGYDQADAKRVVFGILDDTLLALHRNWAAIDWAATALLRKRPPRPP